MKYGVTGPLATKRYAQPKKQLYKMMLQVPHTYPGGAYKKPLAFLLWMLKTDAKATKISPSLFVVSPSLFSNHIYIYTYIHNSKDKVLDYIYIYICTSKDKVLVYIYIYNSKDKVLDYICFLFKKKKTSLFRTLPVRQTSYCFVMVLAIVFIFKDHILVYICSNLHIYIYICVFF